MRKATIVRLFVGSVIAIAAAVVLFLVAGALALGNDVFVMDGPDVVGIKAGLFGWTMLALAALAVLVMLAAVAAQFVAWVGAVLNTAQLPDKTWFVIVLLAGLVSLGFLATLVYVIGGPDGNRVSAEPVLAPTPTPTVARQTAVSPSRETVDGVNPDAREKKVRP